MNEKITEDIVRSHFKDDPLFLAVKLEEQKSLSKRVVELLQGASKTKSAKGIGRPEFIISFPSSNIDYLIVIECKADIAKHRSKTLTETQEYAVDGVLHYAKALSKSYDVLAVAVSGQRTDELQVSHFLWKKEVATYKEIESDRKLLPINDCLRLFEDERFSENLRNVDIIQKAIELNEEYQAYSITELTRCTLVSAILLSLLHPPFQNSYKTEPTSISLGKSMLNAIDTVLSRQKVRNSSEMLGEYQKILNEPIFQQEKIKHKNRKEHEDSVVVLKEMIAYLDRNVYPLTQMEQSGFDVMGRFYTEFIRYAGGEQSQGLVLTPFHITDLFCDLVNVNAKSVIYDPCCGTGGFLIAGMKRMLKLAGNSETERTAIRNEQLVGVELRSSMFTYACSNMLLRGDGKSNIYRGDCFILEKEIKKHHPTIAFLNPPYDVGTASQMRFIEHALNVVSPQSGMVAAIVQMSCGLKNEKELTAVKNRILSKHRLLAVLSMPNDLFYPVGVVTAVMVFQSNEPNAGRKSWFGYFKEDGFEKRKHKGRIDAKARWETICSRWLKAFHDSDEVPGLSVKHEVTANDEWCAEAYMETDYSTICTKDFERKIRDYVAFRVWAGIGNGKENILGATMLSKTYPLHPERWKWFRYGEIFEIKKGKRLTKEDMTQGMIPFIGSTELHNGVTASIETDEHLHPSNTITVSYNGSIGYAFYQPLEYSASDDINVLYPRFSLNKYIAMFLVSLIEKEQYRFCYGRKWHKEKMQQSLIKLPITSKGEPDWELMETYIKSLPYSGNL